MSKRVEIFVALWLLLWITVGSYLFLAMNIFSQPEQPRSTLFLKSASSLQHPPPPRHKYPLCHLITNLPTSLKEFDCSFNLMTDTDYLPDVSLIRFLRQKTTSTVFQHDRAEYLARIDRLQNPQDCAIPSSSVHPAAWHMVKFTSHGHGVNLFHLAVNVGNHYDRNIPVMSSYSAYRFGSHQDTSCSSEIQHGWSCHLSPLSKSCKPDVLEYAVVNWNLLREPVLSNEWCLPHGKFNKKTGRCRCNLGYLPKEDGTTCAKLESFRDVSKWSYRYKRYHEDDDYAEHGTEHWVSRNTPGEVFANQNVHCPSTFPFHRFTSRYPQANMNRFKLKHGFFWWVLLNSWMLHKDAPKRHEMERQAQMYLDSRSCIAVQVRRGDSCHDSTAPHRTCPKLELYVEKVHQLKQKYGLSSVTVYLATDDPSAIEEARVLQTEDRWVWQNISRSRYVNGKAVDNNPELFKDEAMDELYVDLWAISFCELGFVTSFASSVAWNAYALAVGRAGFYIPFISVDLPWGHKILGEHHAKGNVFDGTVEEDELLHDRAEMLRSEEQILS